MSSEDNLWQRLRRQLPLRCRYWFAEHKLRRERADASERYERAIQEVLREHNERSAVEAVTRQYKGVVAQKRKELEDIRLRRFLALADRWDVFVPDPPDDLAARGEKLSFGVTVDLRGTKIGMI